MLKRSVKLMAGDRRIRVTVNVNIRMNNGSIKRRDFLYLRDRLVDRIAMAMPDGTWFGFGVSDVRKVQRKANGD